MAGRLWEVNHVLCHRGACAGACMLRRCPPKRSTPHAQDGLC
uniref:Uncharacterized protein n=1 Tax=Arundo donax TaxID=35708 RepID=A0A0A9AJ81_ARUDO